MRLPNSLTAGPFKPQDSHDDYEEEHTGKNKDFVQMPEAMTYKDEYGEIVEALDVVLFSHYDEKCVIKWDHFTV